MAKNSWDQPNIEPWFKNVNNHDKYDYYVLILIGITKDLECVLIFLHISVLL